MEEKKSLNISAKSFIIAVSVIFLIMVAAYVLTLVVPGGVYERVDGVIAENATFQSVEGGIPFWKWILSPFLVLGAEGSGTILAILAFLLVIGGIFECLGQCDFIHYLLDRVIARFGKNKYALMAVIILLFMGLGSLIGTFEECVPMVPIVVALCLSLGWDSMTGLSISVLAAGCGFAAGVFNPFTVGLAQDIAGLPMFSGAWMRMIAFVCIYILLFLFALRHAKKIEKSRIDAQKHLVAPYDARKSKGVFTFTLLLSVGIALILMSAFIPALRDYTMIIIAVMFLVAGIAASLVCGLRGKAMGKAFVKGMVGFLPAVLMILMASSVKYTLEEAKVMDSILHEAIGAADTMPRYVVLLFIYIIVLVMNLFIASGSAKACMLIPLIMPLAAIYQIPAQLCIMAFAFGDGFSNVLYPTNPVLLISLGLAGESYGAWFKRTWRFQLENFILTLGLLLLGLAVLS